MDRQHQLIVIDQNTLRDSDSIASALDRCCREDLRLLIPEGAGFELSKGSQQFDTWRRSLERLGGYPEFVVVSRKLPDMLVEEIGTGRPCETLIDDDSTTALRQLLDDLNRNDTSSLRRLVDGPMRRLMPASLAAWNNSEQHKQWVIKVRDELSRMMDGEALKELRKSPQDGLVDWLSSVDGIRFVFQGIKSRGATDEGAVLLSSVPSVSGSFVLALAAVGLHWLALGGLDHASSDKITNDLHDVEYAVLGSLSVDLLSKDKRLSTVCRAMSASSHERYEWFRSGRHGS